jgi:hypothetical protein
MKTARVLLAYDHAWCVRAFARFGKDVWDWGGGRSRSKAAFFEQRDALSR